MSKKRNGSMIEIKYNLPVQSFYPPSYLLGMSYNMGGYNGRQDNTLSMDIRWIYVILLAIVVILQFGKNIFSCNNRYNNSSETCGYAQCSCDYESTTGTNSLRSNQLVDNNILFIIIFFFLVMCSGCLREWSEPGCW